MVHGPRLEVNVNVLRLSELADALGTAAKALGLEPKPAVIKLLLCNLIAQDKFIYALFLNIKNFILHCFENELHTRTS